MKDNEPSLETRAIHSDGPQDQHGSPHLPTYSSTTYAFESTADLLDVVEGRRDGALYTRYGMNPTIQALERQMAAIEDAPAAQAFSSGMAAEAALCLTHGRDGIVLVGDAYGGTMELVGDQLPELGITTTLVLADELDRLDAALAAGAGLVLCESPTNPTLEIIDIAALADRSHAGGALLAVDNTFASPVNQRPLQLGADFVVYSATKSLGGHSDLTAGFLLGAADLLAPVWNWRKNLGSMPSPETASLLSRSLRTLALRVRQQDANALAVAEALARHPRVTRVFYPGLASAAGHELACRQMSGFGSMVTFEVDGDAQAAAKVTDALEIFALAPSLGGVESLVTQPITTTHHDISAAERARRGITDAMIRLSVGLEAADDLIADLTRALDTLDA